MLINGTTIHGVQFQNKTKENRPLAYYHRLTPIGTLLSSPLSLNFKNIGVIGLGTGGLSSYAKIGQEIDYFEIDPDVHWIAKNLFTFIKNSKGKVKIIYGDARIAIKGIPAKRYDILVVDAFSGDAIPVHLLTTEAISEYRKHLKNSGIILFHISNRYLDFIPVLFSNANYLNVNACYKNNKPGKDDLYATSWFALTWDSKVYKKLITKFKWVGYNSREVSLIRPWTDKYSDELAIMRLNDLLNSIKYFKPFYWDGRTVMRLDDLVN